MDKLPPPGIFPFSSFRQNQEYPPVPPGMLNAPYSA